MNTDLHRHLHPKISRRHPLRWTGALAEDRLRFHVLSVVTIILIGLAAALAGCNQSRYEPADWKPLGAEGTTLPGSYNGTTLPGTTLPGTTLPSGWRPGTTLPGGWQPGTTLPGQRTPGGWQPGTTLPGATTRGG